LKSKIFLTGKLYSSLRFFHRINREYCSISDHRRCWYYFRLNHWYWQCESLKKQFSPDIHLIPVEVHKYSCQKNSPKGSSL